MRVTVQRDQGEQHTNSYHYLWALLSPLWLQVCRDSVVPIFADLFVALALVYGDSEQNIRNGAEQIDRALKVRSALSILRLFPVLFLII